MAETLLIEPQYYPQTPKYFRIGQNIYHINCGLMCSFRGVTMPDLERSVKNLSNLLEVFVGCLAVHNPNLLIAAANRL